MFEKLAKSRLAELQVWMLSASLIGFGLGAYFADLFQRYAIWIVLVGAIIHGWVMFAIYSKK